MLTLYGRVPIQKRDSKGVSRQGQCVIVATLLGDPHRLLACAHSGFTRLKDAMTDLRSVRPRDNERDGCRVAVSAHRDRVLEILPPPGTAEPPPGDATTCQRMRER